MNVSRATLVGLALAIFAGALWLHWPAVGGGFLTAMDDDEYLRQAVRMKGLTWQTVKWAFTNTQPYYHPLPRLSHVLDYQVWGPNAAGHHATNVVLHALNAALVFGFLWTLLGAAASLTTSERLAVALGVAVVFAIHPLQVESVAWVSGRTQLLCAAFGIGSLWAYVAGARRWVVWALFAAALLSKPMAVSLPFAMLAMDYFPLRRYERLGWGRLLREKAVLIALGVAVSGATMITESRAGGLMAPLEAIRLSQRVFLMVQSLTFYPWKLVWPWWLSPNYPIGSGFSLRLPSVFASALGVAGVTALSIWRRRRTPALAAGWGAYVMFILPVSGLVQTGPWAVADRYAYVAMLPLLLLAGGAAVWLWRRCATVARLAFACLLACELFFFGVRTRVQTLVWRNDETLWRSVLVRFPDSGLANKMLAGALLDQGRFQEALGYAQCAVRVTPWVIDAHNHLGSALFRAGRIEEAIEQYEQALQIQPDYAAAHNNLGVVLCQAGRIEEAIGQYEQALRIQPDYAAAHNNLGDALLRAGRVQEAIGHYEQALRINPDYAEAHYNLGVVLQEADRMQEAIGHYEQALRINPDYAEAHCNLGVAFVRLGGVQEAIGHYEQALRIKPDFAEAHCNLGLVLDNAGKVQEAIGHYEQALRIKPDYAEAHYNLGVALVQLGRVQEAIGQYEQALRIKPDFAEARYNLGNALEQLRKR